jgi:hypothetical protein
MSYRKIEVDNGYGEVMKHIIVDKGNGEFTSFPAINDNPNYQEYLKWVAEGNTPTPADEE